MVLDIFCSYFKNRYQHVKIRDMISNRAAVECDVPQGSILDPNLFLVSDLIRSMPSKDNIKNCSVNTYTDVITLLIHGKDWQETEQFAPLALDVVMS